MYLLQNVPFSSVSITAGHTQEHRGPFIGENENKKEKQHKAFHSPLSYKYLLYNYHWMLLELGEEEMY